MKKFLPTLILIAFALKIAAQQTKTNWTWQAPESLQHGLFDAVMFSSSFFYLSGSGGDFWKTTDGGATFTKAGLPEKVNGYTMFFLNPQEGWIATIDGKVFHTADAGNTWEKQLQDPSSPNFRNIYFVNADTGYVAGDAGFVDNAMYKTTNGGKNWTPITNLQRRPSAQYAGIFYVKAFPGDTVVAASWNNLFYFSSNGGTTWDTTYTYGDNFFEGGYFTDAQHGWLVGPGKVIVHTSDFGNTWTKQEIEGGISGEQGTYFSEVYFLNNQIGWASTFGCLYKTTDGGENWVGDCGVYGSGRKGNLFFLNEEEGIAISGLGIYLTNDGGTSYTDVNDQYAGTFVSTSFINDQTGIVISSSGDIFKTSDGGSNWVKKNATPYTLLAKIDMLNANLGFICGDDGVVLKTTDSGETWTPLTVPTTWDLNAIDIIDANTIIAVGDSNLVVKSTDGGNNWEVKSTKSAIHLFGIHMINAQRGVAVGASGTILLTQDGGETWATIPSGIVTPLRDVFFVNENVGYLVGNNGRIFKSLDGGATWTLQVSGVTSVLFNVHFTDPNNGWIATNNLLRTTDGGATWVRDSTFPSANAILDIYFTDVNTGWAVGSTGNILKYDANTTSVDGVKKSFAATVKAFPNPTSDFIKIGTADNIATILNIYNTSGIKMQTLRSNDGTFDLSGLPQGLYIGMAQIAGNWQSVKIIKLK